MADEFPVFEELPSIPVRGEPNEFNAKVIAWWTAEKALSVRLASMGEAWNNSLPALNAVEATFKGLWANVSSTSTTSMAPAMGVKSLTVETGKGFLTGMPVRVFAVSSPASVWMVGTVTSYNSGTGALVINVSRVGGSATTASWGVIATSSSIEFATASEVLAGAAAGKAVDPLGLASLIPDLPVVPPALNLPFWGMAHRPGGVQFTRASSGTYNSLAGTVKTAGVNIPRFEIDFSTGRAKGLRIETAGTNSYLYSEKLSVIRALTLTSTSGTFQVGETVNGATGSGVVASVDGSVLGLSSITGTFSGTVTGVTSGATGTYSAVTTINRLTRASTTSNVASPLAPDGTATADKLVEDSTAANSHYTTQTLSVTSGTKYTFSLFVNAGERSRIVAQLGAAAFPANCEININASGGTVTAGAGASSVGIENMGNGWYRCWLTATATATTSVSGTIFLSNETSVAYSGDGTSGVYIWGVQFETGDVPTSYIQTANTAITRAADVCTAALSGIDFNVSEGTVFIDAVTPNGYAAFPKCVSLYKDVDNAIYVDRQDSGIIRCIVITGGTVVAQLNLGVVAHNTRFKAAFAWKGNDFKAVLNGRAAVTDNAGALPVGLTSLTVGATPASSTANWNSSIRHLTYFPRALTTAQLQAITL